MRLNMALSFTTLVAIAAFATAGGVQAADYELVCQDPGREYYLTYSVGDTAVLIDPDSSAIHQAVLAFINSDAIRVLVLDVGQPRMVSVLHLRPYLKNDIFSDGQLVQTDACREAGD